MPNEISYNDAGEVQSWGYLVKPCQKRLDHLELMLWSLSTTGGIQPFITHNKRPTDIITDYLSFLRKHIIDTLTSSLGAELLKVVPIDWIFVIPAV